jgi:hypothetical protein
MRASPITAAIILVLLATAARARAADVPDLNVDPVCHGIAQQSTTAGERGGPDLAYSQCVQSEQSVRRKLGDEWSSFTPGETANCVAEEKSAPLPSYTDLETCLEMARTVRQTNQGK